MLVRAVRNFRDQKDKKVYHYKGDEFEVDALFGRGLVKFGFAEVVENQPQKKTGKVKKEEPESDTLEIHNEDSVETPKEKEATHTPKKRGRKPKKDVHNTD